VTPLSLLHFSFDIHPTRPFFADYNIGSSYSNSIYYTVSKLYRNISYVALLFGRDDGVDFFEIFPLLPNRYIYTYNSRNEISIGDSLNGSE
jgi:hypothetical protein